MGILVVAGYGCLRGSIFASACLFPLPICSAWYARVDMNDLPDAAMDYDRGFGAKLSCVCT